MSRHTMENRLARITGSAATRRPVYVTDDPALAERQGGRVLSPHRLRARPGFEARFYDAPLASSSLLAAQYAGRPVVVSTAPMDHHNLTLTLSGAVHVSSDGVDVTAPAGWLMITPPTAGVRVSFDDDTVLFGVRVPEATLDRRLVQITGEPSPAGVRLSRTLRPSTGTQTVFAALRQAFLAVESAMVLPPHLAGAVEEALLTAVLLGVPGAHTDALYRPVEPAAGRAVREAAAMMRDDGPDCPSMPEVADRVGVSLRRLQAGFHATYGTTPTRYLRDVRLDAAHAALQAADRGTTTVAAVATTAGFAHLGRFSAAYRSRFGIDPSATLRGSSASRTGRRSPD